MKPTPLLATPPTVTTTLPVVAPAGTGATMLVALQLVGVAEMPLNLTVLLPCKAPKFAPVIVTDVPNNPEVGFRLVILGAGVVTVKATPLLATPPSVTTTLPVVAPAGTGTTMPVPLQLAGVAVVALKDTVLVPCVVPKFVPVIVMEVPTGPDVGLRLLMLGALGGGVPPAGEFPLTRPAQPLLNCKAATKTTNRTVALARDPQVPGELRNLLMIPRSPKKGSMPQPRQIPRARQVIRIIRFRPLGIGTVLAQYVNCTVGQHSNHASVRACAGSHGSP